jgi:hypothetical protein
MPIGEIRGENTGARGARRNCVANGQAHVGPGNGEVSPVPPGGKLESLLEGLNKDVLLELLAHLLPRIGRLEDDIAVDRYDLVA